MIKIRFCVGTIEYFNSIGFDCTKWRKSIDGTKAICHSRFIEVLCPEYQSDSNITVYECPSQELDDVLNSVEWTNTEG